MNSAESIGWQCSALASAARRFAGKAGAPTLPILDCCKGHADGFGKLPLRQTTATADFCQPRADLSIDVCLNGDAQDTLAPSEC